MKNGLLRILNDSVLDEEGGTRRKEGRGEMIRRKDEVEGGTKRKERRGGRRDEEEEGWGGRRDGEEGGTGRKEG